MPTARNADWRVNNVGIFIALTLENTLMQTEREQLEQVIKATEWAADTTTVFSPVCIVGLKHGNLTVLRNAAIKHLETLPKPPKVVDTWHVEYVYRRNGGAWTPRLALCTSAAEAEEIACDKRSPRPSPSHFREEYANVVVTGPHKRSVPA